MTVGYICFKSVGKAYLDYYAKIIKSLFNKFFSNSKGKEDKPATNPQVRLLNPAKMNMR